jgi:nickel superoxide dismutase
MKKNNILKTLLGIVIILGIASPYLEPHCQVPCGIYDDQMRIDMMVEHTVTIEKAMKSISVLSKENPLNHNQIVRWITNKEKHADELSRIITDYFLAQRIKPTSLSDEKKYSHYQKQLESLHGLLVLSMKSKQSIDQNITAEMKTSIKKFKKLYFHKR